MNGSGSLVVAWSSYGQDGSNFGVYAQRGDWRRRRRPRLRHRLP